MTPAEIPIYSSREQRGWYLYDWANSAFATTVVTLIVATIAGAVFTAADTVSLLFVNSSVPGFPVLVIYTLGAGESATTIATGLKNLINAKFSGGYLFPSM